MDNPYKHDHNPLNADLHGGICSACEWERDERGAPDPTENPALPNDDGWRRMYIEVRQVFEVHVDAEAYVDTSDADEDTELHEYLSDPMRLVEGEIVGVVTDPRLIATYAEQGPSYVVNVKWDRPLNRSTSPVLPCREDES